MREWTIYGKHSKIAAHFLTVVTTMIFKILRPILGRLILLINWLTRPAKIKRTPKEKQHIENLTKNLALYQFHMCPFCVKTRRSLRKLDLPIELRDAKNDGQYRQELLTEGGKVQVPCLRIEEENKVTWLYESKEIEKYLHQRFAG